MEKGLEKRGFIKSLLQLSRLGRPHSKALSFSALVYVVILIIIIIFLLRLPDFSLLPDQNKITIQRGSTAQSSIIVKSIYGYNHKVNLSIEGLPLYVSVDFVSPFEKFVPTYTSVINVNDQLRK